MIRGRSPAAFIHPSNAISYLAVLAGLGAVAAARDGHALGAWTLVGLAVIADTFDGRFARRFTRSRDLLRLGVQLDSLSDAVTFGIVPIVCVSLTLERSTPVVEAGWWIAAFIYVACALTRLGVYNVSHEDTPGFVGLPAPVAALIWASLMTWASVTLRAPGHAAAALTAIALGGLMISPLRIPRPAGAGLAAFVLWPVLVVAASGILWLW